MPPHSRKLLTPIHCKTAQDAPWPAEENVFYWLTRDGLFLCRNHPFFRSCVRAPGWPAELAAQRPFLKLRYPKVPRKLFERIIGFFSIIGERHGAEAAALLAWNANQRRMEVIVPAQCSVVSTGWSKHIYPIKVDYEVPALPAGWTLIGDVHSHVEESAYASAMDVADETHRPGLHIVVGRISQEPPEFHIEATVDGARFGVNDPLIVLEAYECRRPDEVPPAWIDAVTVETLADYNSRRPRPYATQSWFGTNHTPAEPPHATREDPPSSIQVGGSNSP